MNLHRITPLAAVALGLALTAPGAAGAETLVIPSAIAVVLDAESGQPLGGIEVETFVMSGKVKEYRSISSVTTGPDGSAVLDAQPVSDLKKVRFSFSWDAPGLPRRSMRYVTEVKKGAKSAEGKLVKPVKGKGYYAIDGENGGDCTNLFSLKTEGESLQLTFRRPSTYLPCKDNKFKFSNLTSIGTREINKGKINFFSVGDDVRMGQNFYNELGHSAENPVLKDQVVGDYAQNLIDRIGRASDTPDLQFHVQVIDADVLNAFALPGGYVFVYRGLLEAAETESELVGVLAHEIAHVTSRHGTEGMTSAIGKVIGAIIAGEIVASQIKGNHDTAKALVKELVFTGTQFWILGGTRKREAEANHLGAQYAWKAGYDPRGLATFFEKLSQARGYKQTRLEQFFSDHPNDEERILDVSRKVDYFLPPRADLIVSSKEFDAMKARLTKMPPAQASGEIAANALFSSLKAQNENLILNELKTYLDATEVDSSTATESAEAEEEPAADAADDSEE